jgi:soluble lytic murein transglycosylase-like protein
VLKALCTALAAVAAAAPASGRAGDTLYAYVDERGSWHFTDVPDDPRYRPLGERPTASYEAPRAPAVARRPYDQLIDATARSLGVDAALVHAVIAVESAYDARAVSKRGAAGLMQLMPPTAARYRVTDPFDPAQNIRGGTQYLGELLRRFGNDVELALAAYNAGEEAVERHGRRIPPYPETLAYVPRVLRAYVQRPAGR